MPAPYTHLGLGGTPVRFFPIPIVLTPDAVVLEFSVPSQAVDLGTLTVTPSAVQLDLDVPSVDVNRTLTPSAADLEFTVPDVSLSFGTLTLTPDVVNLDLDVPSVDVNRTLTPSAADLEFAVPDVSLSFGTLTLTPDVVNLDLDVPSVAIQGLVTTLTPDPVILEFDTPGVDVNRALTPSAADLEFTVPDVSLSFGTLTLTPDPVILEFDVPAPIVDFPDLIPDAVVLEFSVPDVTVVMNLTLTPFETRLHFAVPELILNGPAKTPDAVILEFDVPAVSIDQSGLNPSVVTLEFDIPNPTLVFGTKTLTPDPVILEFAIPAVNPPDPELHPNSTFLEFVVPAVNVFNDSIAAATTIANYRTIGTFSDVGASTGLSVLSSVPAGGGFYTITLNQAPSYTLHRGDELLDSLGRRYWIDDDGAMTSQTVFDVRDDASHFIAPATGVVAMSRAYATFVEAHTDVPNTHAGTGTLLTWYVMDDAVHLNDPLIYSDTSMNTAGTLLITAPNWHQGVAAAGALVEFSVSGPAAANLFEFTSAVTIPITITRLEFLARGKTAILHEASGDLRIRQCMFHGEVATDTLELGVALNCGKNGEAFIENVLAYDTNNGIFASGTGPVTLDYATIVHGDSAGVENQLSDTTKFLVRNVAAFKTGTIPFTEITFAGGPWHASSANNLASDGNDPEGDFIVTPLANSIRSLVNDNYRPRAASEMLGAALVLSAITVDVAGNTRSTTIPDIGAYEVDTPGLIEIRTLRRRNQTVVHAFAKITDDTNFYWYLDGQFVKRTRSDNFTFSMGFGEQARVDVVLSDSSSFDPHLNPPVGWPGRRSLWWVRSLDTDIAHYRVEQQKSGGAWTTIARVHDRPHRWTYYLLTPTLDDLTDYVWRVIPVDRAGNDGTALALSSEHIVRTPVAPDFTASFDAATTKVAFADA